MPKVRVLVVDDAVVFRKLVSDVLTADPDLEVAGTAANGKIALAKLTQVNPDAVILDVEMPEMDGLQTLKEIRKTHPRLPVIMFSSLTQRGAMTTIEALSLGATDYFAKPNCVGGLDASLQVVRDELVPKIKAVCEHILSPTAAGMVNPLTTAIPGVARRSATVDVVSIGVSTGGPNALAKLFETIPRDCPVPILIVQHMPPMFTRILAERLACQTGMIVREAESGCVLEPGQVWIAPGDYHMIALRDGLRTRLLIQQDPPENSCRPAADVLFRSVARTYGPNALAVVMTGMGQDGLRGCECIKEAGGQIIVQDEATSVVWGMPGYVARAGLAEKILPLSDIGNEIAQRVRQGRK